ncbi:hypothetical protein DBR43_31505 [Pedobacter sp. KBW06]|uniref:non-ribosomal peptide synthetase n=1 Tax=Pedobacter sp. KBW06 TaxID=2153359 RepID=UPI000F5A3576|nr:non-ribosomal peptide synthetase [Pedobacter sp. KBW06]RQO65364.1 hypothetical protein DBR43_31505 [Pedobacter sp. KBW06]
MMEKDTIAQYKTQLSSIVSEIFHMELGEIDRSLLPFDYDFDSVQMIRFVREFNETFDLDIKMGQMFIADDFGALFNLLESALLQKAKAASEESGQVEATGPEIRYPLSEGQKGLFFIQHFDPGHTAYNIPVAFTLNLDVPESILSEALTLMLTAHPILRMNFYNDQESAELYQSKNGKAVVPLVYSRDGNQETHQEGWLSLQRKPFDLKNDCLLRLYASVDPVKQSTSLLFVIHHIVFDGTSSIFFVRSFLEKIEYLMKGEKCSDQAEDLAFFDYVNWEQAYMNSEKAHENHLFWKEKLSGPLPVLSLPFDQLFSKDQDSREMASETLILDAAALDRLKILARALKVNLSVLLLSIYNVFLSKITGDEDIILTTPTAGRPKKEHEQGIGYFINMMIVRNQVSAKTFFNDFVNEVKLQFVHGIDHAAYPFPKLISEFGLGQTHENGSVLRAGYLYQNFFDAILDKKEGIYEKAEMPTDLFQESEEDYLIEVCDFRKELRINLKYNRHLFHELTIKRHLGYFKKLLTEVQEDCKKEIKDYDIVPEAESQQLFSEWNNTTVAYLNEVLVHELFEKQVLQTPESIALVYEGEELSYFELNRKAEQLARYLRTKGLKDNALVAICVDRSLEMMIGLLGILKAGSAYVPLDFSYPIDRLQYILDDSGAGFLLASAEVLELFPAGGSYLPLCLDENTWENELMVQETGHLTDPILDRPAAKQSTESLAYVIYTSGSTGKPKGVGVRHRNVMNFFKGMDLKVGNEESQEVWLAVTSISFDISVLELFWTICKGSKVVIQPDRPVYKTEKANMDFSLFFFAAQEEVTHCNKYELLRNAAQFADQHGLSGVWIPERHFHTFGDQFPNPSVAAAAVAVLTSKIKIRAGSVVLPLHDPVRVAEEWSMVDHLSEGRVELSFASGWHPNDFIFSPGDYEQRHQKMREKLLELKDLWEGATYIRKNGAGNDFKVQIHPKPVQQSLPVWITAAGNPETFIYAGSIGANLLTHLLGQNKEELGEKIKLYRRSLTEHGFDANHGKVALMLHSFVSEDLQLTKEVVREPFKNYLRHSVDLIKPLAKQAGLDMDKDLEAIVEMGFERYFQTSGLFGTPETCMSRVWEFTEIGVDEIACLVDYGIDNDTIMSNLPNLVKLQQLLRQSALHERFLQKKLNKAWLPEENIRQQGVTHLQCTPSFAQELITHQSGQMAIGRLKKLLIGGEALSPALAADIFKSGQSRIFNMYGPTETTIWSTVKALGPEEQITIGGPIANTQIYILSPENELVPIGVTGELCIGGDGLTAGYLNRKSLNDEKFIDNPFDSGKLLYRTGDLARWLPDGEIECLGRIDNQIKLRGHRIELGEIENALSAHQSIQNAVVIVKEQGEGKQLLAYYVPVQTENLQPAALKIFLQKSLPDYMIPSLFIPIEQIPLTLNGKVNRKVLEQQEIRYGGDQEYRAPGNDVEKNLVRIWKEVLGLDKIGVSDNFFELGGDSIKSIQVISKANQMNIHLTTRQLFDYQTIEKLAPHSLLKRIHEEPAVLTGAVGLTPVQHYYFSLNHPKLSHFNHAVLLEIDKRISTEQLKIAFSKICAQHDAFQLRFRKEGETWHQQFSADALPADFLKSYDLSAVSPDVLNTAIENVSGGLHASLDIEEGPLIRVGHLLLAEEQSSHRLLISIHHLVIDGVSWRILISDLLMLLKTADAVLPARTTSYQYWSASLSRYAFEEEIKEEQSYWLKQAAASQSLPKLVDTQKPLEKANRIFARINTSLYQQLITVCNQAYHTQINDLIISALYLSYREWSGRELMPVYMEGHGREELFEDIDVSRTTGWFTSIFPVLIEAPVTKDLPSYIKTVKTILRAVPDKGIGYGILKYLTEAQGLRDAAVPELMFNYLGDLNLPPEAAGLLTVAEESFGNMVATENRSEDILVNGMLNKEGLNFEFKTDYALKNGLMLEQFAAVFEQQLTAVIEHCASPSNFGFTPSDFPLLNWDQIELDGFLAESHSKERQQEILHIYPLSALQEGILFETMLSPDSMIYKSQMILTLSEEIDLNALEAALEKVANEYDVLRTSFYHEGMPVPVQVVYKARTIEIEKYTLSGNDPAERNQQLEVLLKDIRSQRWDLSKDQLLKVAVVKYSEQESKLILTRHHIILDGWSNGIFSGALLSAYIAVKNGKQLALTASLPYYKYIEALQQMDSGKAEHFWSGYLSDISTRAVLPLSGLSESKMPQSRQSFKELSFLVSEDLTRRLKIFSRTEHITLNSLIQSCLALMLCKLSGEKNILLGDVSSGRTLPGMDLSDMVGLLINTTPGYFNIDADESAVDFLHRNQNALQEKLEYEHTPLSLIHQYAQLSNNEQLFQVLYAYENFPVNESAITDLSSSFKNLEALEEDHYPLAFNCKVSEVFTIGIKYDEFYYDGDTAERFFNSLEHVIDQVLAHPEGLLSSIDLLTSAERKQLLVEWNDTFEPYPEGRTFVDLFEEQALKTPDRIALAFEGRQLTYKTLNERSNQLANYLRNAYQIKPDDFIGIKLKRSEAVIVAILAVLKSGAAYIPIDFEYPEDRIRYMVEQSQCKVLVDQQELDLFALVADSSSEENPEKLNAPESLAYVIFTSGSTGRPKGTMITHEGMLNHLYAMISQLELTSESVIVQNASFSFDISVWQSLTALMTGGTTLVLGKEEILDPAVFLRKVNDCEVSILQLVPAYLNSLLDIIEENGGIHFTNLKYLLVTGETFHSSLLKRWLASFPGIKVVNAYGPAEAADDVTLFFTDTMPYTQTIPIGFPVQNMRIYIVDEHMALCPVGVPGEICVAGIGVGRGYLNNTALTEQKFMDDPFFSEVSEKFRTSVPDEEQAIHKEELSRRKRLYRTGDIGRWLPDGNIECLGRQDDQVKIRGYRIELGEIENTLQGNPSVTAAAVVVRENKSGDKYLIAYFVSPEHLEPSALKTDLENRLPAYMIPAAFVRLEKLPLTANGKIDRKDLAGRAEAAAVNCGLYEGARNETEARLLEIWAKVLKKEVAEIGIHDDFFALGGHSLLSVRLNGMIKKAFELDHLELQFLFRYPTISMFSRVLSHSEVDNGNVLSRNSAIDKHLIELRKGDDNAIVSFVIPGMPGIADGYFELAGALPGNGNVYGLQMKGLFENEQPLNSIPEIAEAQLMLIRSIADQQEINLVAHSYGCLVAYELLKQLQFSADLKIANVFLIDGYTGLLDNRFSRADIEMDFLKGLEQISNQIIIGKEELIHGLLQARENDRPAALMGELEKRGIDISSAYLQRLYQTCVTSMNIRYKPEEKLPYPVISILAHEGAAKPDGDKDWSRYYQDIRTVKATGTHFSMVKEPHCRRWITLTQTEFKPYLTS